MRYCLQRKRGVVGLGDKAAVDLGLFDFDLRFSMEAFFTISVISRVSGVSITPPDIYEPSAADRYCSGSDLNVVLH